MPTAEQRKILYSFTEKDPSAEPVIRKKTKDALNMSPIQNCGTRKMCR